MNPFKYGMVASGKDFCGRKALLKEICDHVASSQRIAIPGERRIGKTSAVFEAIRRCKNAQMLYVDLPGIESVDGMCRKILKAIVVKEQKKGRLEKVFKAMAHLKPSISIDPVTALPTVSFDSSIEMKADSIHDSPFFKSAITFVVDTLPYKEFSAC
jgi:uncharacterized protein